MRDRTAREQVERLDRELRSLEEVAARLRGRVDEMELTESRLREIEVEWADTFEKFRNLYARISKRIERAEPPPAEPNGSLPHDINPLALNLLKRGVDS